MIMSNTVFSGTDTAGCICHTYLGRTDSEVAALL